MDRVLKGIVPFAMPGDRKFEYPVDRKRTKQSTEAMRKAEANLDLFWSKFDANWKNYAGRRIDDCMGYHTPRNKGQEIERTVPWVEPTKEPKVTINSTPKEPKPWTDTKDEIAAVKPKKKTKTKGAGQIIEPEGPASEAPSVQPEKQPTFKVDKTSLKVFNTLFFTPGRTGGPGEIPWIDFLHAMAKTGFSAQKLYGSIYQFTPTTLDVERSIQFHEPHPAVKIRFTVARRIGRRLTRAYGWHGEMFELEK